MAFDKAAMDEAGQRAHEELANIRIKATSEQCEGMDLLINWLRAHYRTAGYKRLCRPLVYKKKEEQP